MRRSEKPSAAPSAGARDRRLAINEKQAHSIALGYGGLGVVLAIYFWLALSSAIIVWRASLSPALADRRNLRRAP